MIPFLRVMMKIPQYFFYNNPDTTGLENDFQNDDRPAIDQY